MALSLIGGLNMHRGSFQDHLSNTTQPNSNHASPNSDEEEQSSLQPAIQDWMTAQFFARTHMMQQEDASCGDDSCDAMNKQNDFDRGSKKRRKQPKPVRISEESGGVVKEAKMEIKDEEENSQSDSGERSSIRMESNESSEVGKFLCPYCNEALESEPQLVMHFQEYHVNKIIFEQLKRQQLEEQILLQQQHQLLSQGHDAINPFRYQLPAWRKDTESPERTPNASPKGEAKQDTLGVKAPFQLPPDKMSNAVIHPGMLPFPPNPFLFPFVNSAPTMQSGQVVPTNGPQIRIFNPEAYCELCNKEFCNKYFLKTHKANKHGIYSETTPSSQGSQQSSTYQNGFQQIPPQAIDSRVNITSQEASPKQPYLKPLNGPELQLNESKVQVNISNSVFSPASSQGLLSSLMKPGTIINPDAYCELCQKEFCNKYFLKRHKSKIHGIQENSSNGNTPMPQSSSSPVASSGKNSNYPFFASEYISSIAGTSAKSDREEKSKDDPQQTFSHCVSENKERMDQEKLRELGVQNIEAFCDFCFKEFCNKETLKIHKWKKHGVPLKESPGIGSDYQNLPLDLTRGIDNSKSEEEQDQACRICNMSFQNQYLLRMHESYFHSSKPEGVVRDFSTELKQKADEPKSESSDDLQKLQTMIKDLSGQDLDKTMCKICVRPVEKKLFPTHMLKEHGSILEGNQEQSTRELSSHNKDVRKRSSESGGHQTFCDICRKDFFAAYFLQVHMQTVHGVGVNAVNPFSLPDNTGRSFVDRITGKNEEIKKRNSSQPPRSYCEICNKELCNKYFMKTHMLKMHGISVEAGSPLQGVSCEICQKELSSKYFLKVHKQNAHGIYDEHPLKEEEGISAHALPQEFCPLCQKPFKNPKWLKMHLTQDHGEQGRETWHSIMSDRQKQQEKMPSPLCSTCGDSFPDVVSLQVHIIKHHPSQQMSEISASDDQISKNSKAIQSSELMTPKRTSIKKKSGSSDKFRCKKCWKRFPTKELCLYHLLSKHRRNRLSASISVRRKSAKFRCKACGYQSRDLQALKLHIKNKHKKSGCNLDHLPKSFAVPQVPVDSGRFHMQAFLMAEPINDDSNYESSQVVPSVVYLPVSQKISSPVSITFTLTPAQEI
ncbi:uncharacterized protein LOC136025686 [Artemia franciscana]|uniref:C2H2-type domain-containing protein n=1 Tax=Artemia franciscana TaxID=6661 RepID=A0AA88KZD7_ARTSF|nr:hypothetical protein QYM36_011896 [Artemia franciscana]